jgi:hypothetical protein
LLLGAQLLSLGLIAELITAYQGRPEDDYSIAEKTSAKAASVSVERPPDGTANHDVP